MKTYTLIIAIMLSSGCARKWRIAPCTVGQTVTTGKYTGDRITWVNGRAVTYEVKQ